MTYEIENVAKTLNTAREAKGLSQRDVSKLAAVPQSHISRIESGIIDLRLSSLIEIARVLDLEMTLVPRKALPAVQSIIHACHPRQITKGESSAIKELKRLQASLNQIARQHPATKEIAQIQRQVRDLQRVQGAPAEMAALRQANKTVKKFKDNPQGKNALQQTLASLQQLRNKAVHAPPSADMPKPAYSLGGGDDE
jgi:transcriptional regulator with XRE-family HTH domain